MAQFTRIGAYAGAIAAASMTIAPAQAAEVMPSGTIGYASAVHADFSRGGGFDSSSTGEQAETAEWRGRGWRGRRGWRGHRRGGSGLLTGILVLGGIAAVASAANNNRRNRDVVIVERDSRRYDDRRYDDRRTDDRRSNPRSSEGSGIDNAVSQCLSEIESDVRVDSVDGASRLPQGWVVSGTLFNGSGFTCQIDNNGRISDIDYSGFSGSSYDGSDGEYSDGEYSSAAGQLDDDRYADARSAIRAQGYQGPDAQRSASSGQLPAYPGGPLPGEAFSD